MRDFVIFVEIGREIRRNLCQGFIGGWEEIGDGWWGIFGGIDVNGSVSLWDRGGSTGLGEAVIENIMISCYCYCCCC